VWIGERYLIFQYSAAASMLVQFDQAEQKYDGLVDCTGTVVSY